MCIKAVTAGSAAHMNNTSAQRKAQDAAATAQPHFPQTVACLPSCYQHIIPLTCVPVPLTHQSLILILNFLPWQDNFLNNKLQLGMCFSLLNIAQNTNFLSSFWGQKVVGSKAQNKDSSSALDAVSSADLPMIKRQRGQHFFIRVY